jgi:hypothetical protein
MRLTPPKKWVFWTSVVLVVVGVLASLITIPFLSGFAFWLVVIGYLFLFAGNAVKGF